MEPLVESQNELSGRIARAYENLKKLGAAKITPGAVESRLGMLRKNWEKFDQQHDQLLALIAPGKREIPYFLDDRHTVTEELFLVQEALFADKLQTFMADHNESGTSNSSPTAAVRSKASLPRLPLPEFEGNYESWPEFRDLFRSLVIRDGTLTDVERLHYLRGCLKGDALLALRKLPVRAATFARAWDLLQDHYENERLLVQAQMATIFGLPTLTRESSTDLKSFYFTVCDCVEALAAMERPFDATGDWLVHWVVEKLDPQSLREWETQLGPQMTPPTFDELKAFMKTRITTVGALERGKAKGQAEGRAAKPTSGQRSAKVLQVTKAKRPPEQCGLCGGNHFVLFCGAYKAKSASERREALVTANLCFNCLGRHQVAECPSDKRCQRCERKHHTSIHEDDEVSDTPEELPVSTNTSRLETPALPAVLLATARIQVLPPDGEPQEVRALIDQGSEVSLVSEALAQQLRLPRGPSSIRIVGIGGRHSERAHGQVRLEFKARSTCAGHQTTTALVLPRITSYQPRLGTRTGSWAHLDGLVLADPDFTGDDPIDVLLGADVYSLVLAAGVRKGRWDEPVAQKTSLGWIISGPAPTAEECKKSGDSLPGSLTCTATDELLPLLQRFWEQEEIPEPTAYSVEDQRCEDHYQETHKRLPSGRYQVRLPFRDGVTLGDSRHGARRMLQKMETRFHRDPTLARTYVEFMREYSDLTHMSKVSGHDLTGFSYYLPHHGVLKESSTTTKLRVVFNGSYQSTNGKSLNDLLLVGPNLLPSLPHLLLRWRTHKVCMTADVEKMYRQILVHPDDRRYQRILWRERVDSEMGDYNLNTVTYGLACAPFLAIRTLHQLALDEQLRFPRAATLLRRDVYMDDVVTGADSVPEALEIQAELRQLCRAGGFNLRKWASNQPVLMERLPEGDAIPEVKWQTEATHRALGVHWSLLDDSFRVRVQADPVDQRVTRRLVLSKLARIFDPLGLVSPVTITAKIFLQSLWLLKVDWDTPLPALEAEDWRRFLDELPTLNGIAVPRWLRLHPSTQSRELHGFADASERAYAAVIYLRTVDAQGQVRSQLVTSKTKVAPLKKVTLPRLELCAAALLSRLMSVTRESMGLESVATHLWSDSTITLDWIRGHSSWWKTYVANRVAAIQRELPDAQWHHVSGLENPADCASRGLPPSQLPDFALWWTGPAWLNSSSDWTEATSVDRPLTDLEARVTTHVAASGDPALGECFLTRFSSLQSLLRFTAWSVRWLKYRRRSRRDVQLLQPAELDAARSRWITLVQRQEFATDVRQLELERPLLSRSKLLRLAPFLDEHGLLRVGGRLMHAPLSVPEKHPIILPKEGSFTELIVDEAHRQTLHGGVQLTLATLRQRYWLLQGRQKVKAHIHRCLTCVRWRSTPGQQLMADLPAARVNPGRPFLHVGLDYAGPYLLLASRGRGQRTHKGYIAVFQCMTTRALHLELISDYSSEAFIAALRRFTARRGLCSTIYSDRGTTFVGADRELRTLLPQLVKETGGVRAHLTREGIDWRFNPPAAPHFGGTWEAAVKSVKHHLRRVIGEQKLTFEEMTTLLTQIEACLNSRPLQPLSDDPDDISALTPGHFLIGAALLSVPDPPVAGVAPNRLSRWHLIQQMRLHFWQRWSSEYLQQLQARHKWTQLHPSPRVGDLCLLRSELLSPAKWPLARVSQLHPGSDGLTRVVTIKTSRTELQRPICKLVFLPFVQDDPANAPTTAPHNTASLT